MHVILHRHPSKQTRSASFLQGDAAAQPALTAMLVSSGESTNPFAELYAAVSGRGEGASTNVQVYFPSARAPKGQAMDLNVRKVATAEEVIGFALWSYREEGWLPKLDEGMENAEEEKLATRLSAVGWILRIAEEDGEVNDDFPPPYRMSKVAKFNFEAYAVLEANPAQSNMVPSTTQFNRTRRTKAGYSGIPLSSPRPRSTCGGSGSALGGSVPFLTSLGPMSGHGPQIFLRFKVEDIPDTIHVATTIPVSAGMYMQEVLERVCRKTKLDHPEAYALLLDTDNMRILIPLDRTVASLQGKRQLVLIRREMIDDNVERTLAFDGLYIHILPTANKVTKVVFDSGKHVSYHIRNIADCQQLTKSSAIFKLVIGRASGKKRYDYEAESAKHASMDTEESGTLKASRRSRAVG
ncbi:stress-activated map kinase interacting protein 1-domain-containing protein [Mycena polygramma]|nr:stress-activated map kinase interacting protein 1-domain-containing protein [Mycena polygramma]